MFIQVLLILTFAYISARVLGGRESHAMNAWKKIGIGILTLLMVVSVVVPDITNRAANLLGIGRGADLLLYVFFATFLVYILAQYLRQKDSTDKINRLAREIALSDARSRYQQQPVDKP